MLFGQGQCHCPPRQPVRSCSAPAHCRTPSAQEEPPAPTALLVSSKVSYRRVAYDLLPASRTGRCRHQTTMAERSGVAVGHYKSHLRGLEVNLFEVLLRQDRVGAVAE